MTHCTPAVGYNSTADCLEVQNLIPYEDLLGSHYLAFTPFLKMSKQRPWQGVWGVCQGLPPSCLSPHPEQEGGRR